MGTGSRRVYDFLMSIDYGLCFGPLDNLNKVWVKDKSILCGNYADRVDIPVIQPELFGGDDAEGGVVGTIEYYPGTDDQLSSTALASRFGRTPANMPGYRGLAHLFFRGAGETGFRWSTNNPYLPGVKASVSRFPTGLGALHSKIYPVADVVEEPVDPMDLSLGTIFNPQSSQDGIVNVTYPDNFTDAEAMFIPLGGDDWQYGATATRPTFVWLGTNNNITITDGQIVAGGGSFNFFRDLRLSDLGIDDDMVDNGEVQVEIQFRGVPSGGNTTVALSTYDAADLLTDPWGVTSALAQTVQSPAGAETQTSTVLSSLPSGTRAFRVQATSFGGWFAFDFITIRWKAKQLAFCDPDNEGLRLLPNANPAHVIYEALVDPEWGKGEDPLNIDTTTFTAAAATFFNEYFGLGLKYVRQSSIEDFVQEVLNHTNSLLFIHPRTGLWTLKPLRDDYSTAGLRTLNATNADLKKRRRKAWGETVNEIVVKYTDPATEDEASVTAHNLANIAIQGGVISQTLNYYGIRDAWLAQSVADREARAQGYPLFSAQVEADRTFWDVVPGDVLKLSWPEDGITDMIVRVMRVKSGKPTDRKITLDVVEDVFALEQTAYGNAQGSEWVSQRALPQPLDAETAITAPLPSLVLAGYTPEDVDARYPGVSALLMGDDDAKVVIDMQAHTNVTQTNGSSVIESVVTVSPSRSGLLTAALVQEAQSTLPGSLIATVTLGGAAAGDLLMVGMTEDAHEIVMLESYDSNADTWTVSRGIWDTVPGEWPIGTRLWEFPVVELHSDPNERAAGETTVYRLLPRTSEGILGYGQAANLSFTATERPHLPFRPANCQIDGNGFGDAVFGSGVSYPITVTWANRNRTVEDQVALTWTAANVTPETGQTTVLRVLDETGTMVSEITGLTGTSYDMQAVDFAGVTFGFIEFVSERGGLRSRPGARRVFDLRAGFGFDYGNDYGN